MSAGQEGWLAIAGLGPGDEALITPEVREALAMATDVIGYTPMSRASRPGPA
jgi:precorrin-3B C17-methyltransferase